MNLLINKYSGFCCRVHVGRYVVPGDGHTAQRVKQVIHVPPPPPAPEGCKDLNPKCGQWALSGECESNQGYMVGRADNPGSCLLSCERCDLASLVKA